MSAVCGVACTASINWYFGAQRDQGVSQIPIGDQSGCVLLFQGADLYSATANATALLGESQDWQSLHGALVGRFPTFPETPDMTAHTTPTLLAAADAADPWRVVIEAVGDRIRVELVGQSQNPPSAPDLNIPADKGVIETLSYIADTAPYPIWRVDQTETITWYNRAYDQAHRQATGEAPDSGPALFSELAFDHSDTQRAALACDGEQAWYDVSRQPHGDGHVFFATDVSPVVSAETTQRNFVQTLAKTFAQLSIGLAIFDRNMQLVLFNPALTDLTSLPPEYLSGRPNLLTFFDRLRDARVMPEPKDYASWRDQMAALVAQANDGRYSETWALPSGSTYRVTGRPHPDGAVAFLFEDISAEMSLTRRFRSDLELNQSILDELDDAIGVFSASGTLTVTNKAYNRLWAMDPDTSFADVSIIDAMRDWDRLGGAQPLWGEVRDFVFSQDNRVTWTAALSMQDGRGFDCVVHPLQSGATLVRFMETATDPQTTTRATDSPVH